MADFRFKLESLLTYRRHQRDQCRQLLGEVLAEQQASLRQKQELLSERDTVLADMRSQSASGPMNISQAAAQRYYAANLDGQVRGVDAAQQRYDQQLELCRRALVQADMAVKSLEQIREKRLKKHQAEQLKRDELQLQEAWSAVSRGGKVN